MATTPSTPPISSLRQLEDRSVEQDVAFLEWSPKMDVVAVGAKNGELALLRLNWQKIWLVPPPAEGVVLRGVSWRWDGRVLAAAYSNGEIQLRQVENQELLHKTCLDDGIATINWIRLNSGNNEGTGDIVEDIIQKEEGRIEDKAFGLSPSPSQQKEVWHFLKKLPLLSKIYSSKLDSLDETVEIEQFSDDTPLTVLLVTLERGELLLYVNGFLLCSKINVDQLNDGKTNISGRISIQSVTASSNLTTFSVIYKENEVDALKMTIFQMPMLSACLEELQVLAQKYSILKSIRVYLDNLLKQLTEAYEEIVVEMDVKLSSYANRTDSIAADFLELLMFGLMNPDLEFFLLSDLTEKGLKKLEVSVDASYLNIQRLVLKYLHVVSQAINFHVDEFIGIVKSSNKFEYLGVTEASVLMASHQAASFWSKGLELQQVVDESRKSFKMFFHWLLAETLKLNDDPLPANLACMSQRDITHIADFLSSFDIESQSSPRQRANENDQGTLEGIPSNDMDMPKEQGLHRHLERVGQYLKNEPLDHQFDRSQNLWYNFVQKNPELKDIEFITKVNKSSSLLQEHHQLEDSIEKVFQSMNIDMTDQCQVVGSVNIPYIGQLPFCRQMSCYEQYCILTCFSQSCMGKTDEIQTGKEPGSSMVIFNLDCSSSTLEKPLLKGLILSFVSLGELENIRVVDGRFYNEDTLSLLCSHPKSSDHQRLIQVPIGECESLCRSIPLHIFKTVHIDNINMCEKSISQVADRSCHRDLEHLNAIQLSVSGPRRVSAVLFKSCRRVRIYDMEVDEDEDDEEDDNEDEDIDEEE